MNTLDDHQLSAVTGGGDTLAKDVGQFLGGATGWVRANMGLYLLLGPGIGGLAAIEAGLTEAQR